MLETLCSYWPCYAVILGLRFCTCAVCTQQSEAVKDISAKVQGRVSAVHAVSRVLCCCRVEHIVPGNAASVPLVFDESTEVHVLQPDEVFIQPKQQGPPAIPVPVSVSHLTCVPVL